MAARSGPRSRSDPPVAGAAECRRRYGRADLRRVDEPRAARDHGRKPASGYRYRLAGRSAPWTSRRGGKIPGPLLPGSSLPLTPPDLFIMDASPDTRTKDPRVASAIA